MTNGTNVVFPHHSHKPTSLLNSHSVLTNSAPAGGTMNMLTASSSSLRLSFSPFPSLLQSPRSNLHSKLAPAFPADLSSSDCHSHPLRVSVNERRKVSVMKRNRRGFSTVCYAAPLTARNIQWISTIALTALMFAKGTAINKSFLAPIFALLAPSSIISWIKGQDGAWAAFLALLVRLFFFIPGELELPLTVFLLIITAPSQVMNLRGTQEGAIIALVIAGYLAFQHFSWAGNFTKAFDQGSIIATLAIVCITVLTCLLLI